MNYEEMLNAQDGVAQHKEQLPLGTFYKKQKEGKYRNVIELKAELTDSLVFCEAIKNDQRTALTIGNAHQLKYELHEDSGGIYELELEPGNYVTLAQQLASNPATVAQKGFINDTVNALFELTSQLHERGIFHLCYAPETIFMRKGNSSPLLLCHGSSFLGMKNQAALYAGFEKYVAPEVLSGEGADERSDVYALGRFLESLLESSSIPYEYKGVIKKSTADNPDKRYSTIAAMKEALSAKRNSRRSMIMLIAACVVVGLLVWGYFDLLPKSSNVEFIDNPKNEDPFLKEYDDTLVNDQPEYLDPEIAAYMDSIDLSNMSDADFHNLADSVKNYMKVEEIFRKRFQKAANGKFATLYSQDNMSGSESDFVGHSQKTIDELMDYASKLAEETGLPKEQANSMASQIITEIQVKNREDKSNVNSSLK